LLINWIIPEPDFEETIIEESTPAKSVKTGQRSTKKTNSSTENWGTYKNELETGTISEQIGKHKRWLHKQIHKPLAPASAFK